MSFTYYDPATLSDALALSDRLGVGARYISGGTDLVIQMRRKKLAPEHVIDLQHVAPLKRIDLGKGEIGALVTHRELEHEARQVPGLLGLAESACVIGGHQVRNVGTVGGNLCNASPAADLVPILLVLDATVHLTSSNGSRHLVLAEFLLGPGKTALATGEILTSVSVQPLPDGMSTAFLKAGRRRAMEISIISVACTLELDGGGQVKEARIAVGAAAPVPFRAREAEIELVGRAPSDAAFAKAGELAAQASAPIADVRASAEYRRHLVAKTVARALHVCHDRCKESAHA